MSKSRAFIRQYPLSCFYVLTFVISWGGIFLVIVRANGIPATKEELGTIMSAAVPALLGGPSVAGLLLTGLVYGKEGFRSLLSRMLAWRAGLRWYAAALMIGPLVLLAELLALSLFSPVFTPGIFATSDREARLVLAIAAGLDRVCHAGAQTALRDRRHRAYRGRALGSMAHSCERHLD